MYKYRFLIKTLLLFSSFCISKSVASEFDEAMVEKGEFLKEKKEKKKEEKYKKQKSLFFDNPWTKGLP